MGKFNKRDSNFGGRGGDRSGDRRGGFGGSGGGMMHQAICDECGKSCEVPFRPTQGKPIYCNACFRSKRGTGDRRPESFGASRDFSQPRQAPDSNQTQRQLEMINQKLDKLLKMLAPQVLTEMPVIKSEKKDIPVKKEKATPVKEVKVKAVKAKTSKAKSKAKVAPKKKK
ncbi:hypothetical protein COU05_00050 [bacterium (Candidatus Gribaldobacteria) CG10_big_fil_rev_8_21_14_0_10_37_21]|uniref:CxxC-x17-CxxC domain-containing protein n=2 Tax=Candidatus Gribaldobacteria TaxID=2798536 RepID=A0A2H0UVH2_9BACT|nr:MAG: hypothetical protein AUJ25_01775 [Parcubacteria group bacterium CG1_02_37_13]PIR90803.1 MAG: hypothetical protein COU05_00050 [bacterium (Candidatus Gribaldobacteria) CG10_big_fil_rev_8_21_14_0_10_37_21]